MLDFNSHYRTWPRLWHTGDWMRFCVASFTARCCTVARVHVMCGLSLESWAVCHVGRSCETGAEMKRLAMGSRVCLLHRCSDRPLVFFQRVWEHVCESENLLTFLLGLCRCVWLEGCMPLRYCTLAYATENNSLVCLSVFMCQVIDVRDYSYRCWASF